MPIETVKEFVKTCTECGISFWYLAGQAGHKGAFWDTSFGRAVLAVLPGIITAVLTASATVGSIYLSMRDDMTTLRQAVVQMQQEHRVFVVQQDAQDKRINEVEKDTARLRGYAEGSTGGHRK